MRKLLLLLFLLLIPTGCSKDCPTAPVVVVEDECAPPRPEVPHGHRKPKKVGEPDINTKR